MKNDGLRVVGWGPFPVIGEKRRRAAALQRAEEIVSAMEDWDDQEEVVESRQPADEDGSGVAGEKLTITTAERQDAPAPAPAQRGSRFGLVTIDDLYIMLGESIQDAEFVHFYFRDDLKRVLELWKASSDHLSLRVIYSGLDGAISRINALLSVEWERYEYLHGWIRSTIENSDIEERLQIHDTILTTLSEAASQLATLSTQAQVGQERSEASVVDTLGELMHSISVWVEEPIGRPFPRRS
ncbi:MAG TPA: hypothetical protein VGD71_20890 [Kribbella sp.]